MDTLTACAVAILVVCLIAFAISILRVSVRHTKPDERVVYWINPSNIKVLGPGWVVANPFRGRLLLISLNEQNCQLFLDEKATTRINISYRITDIEKAVETGISQGQMLLSTSNLPEKEKPRQVANFIDPVMANIRSQVSVFAILIFKEVSEEHKQDISKYGREIDEFCKDRLQKRFSDRGIDIIHVETSPSL